LPKRIQKHRQQIVTVYDLNPSAKGKSMNSQAHAELFTPEFQANPHPVYAQLRAESPVTRILLPGGTPAWLVCRYADARAALTDPRLRKNAATTAIDHNTTISEELMAATNTHMLAADPPDHTRLRRLVSSAFTARRIEQLRPRIQGITNELLDAMADADRVDLIDALAFPLPIRVICELLGVPRKDQAPFRQWSSTIVSGANSPHQLRSTFEEMLAYLRDLIARKRATPGNDLLSALIAVRDEGDRLSENELTSTIFILLIAGHETTVNLIGNAVYLLLSERDRWEQLRANLDLLPEAIEEFLRYESPVETATARITAEPVEIGGTLIPAGEVVLISLLAGNRDSDQFSDPNQLDITRSKNQHLAFGHGIHYCLGAPLARLEAQVALGTLLTRYPSLHLATTPDQLHWRPGILMRGLSELPVRSRQRV
jgi:cytochrome P450